MSTGIHISQTYLATEPKLHLENNTAKWRKLNFLYWRSATCNSIHTILLIYDLPVSVVSIWVVIPLSSFPTSTSFKCHSMWLPGGAHTVKLGTCNIQANDQTIWKWERQKCLCDCNFLMELLLTQHGTAGYVQHSLGNTILNYRCTLTTLYGVTSTKTAIFIITATTSS